MALGHGRFRAKRAFLTKRRGQRLLFCQNAARPGGGGRDEVVAARPRRHRSNGGEEVHRRKLWLFAGVVLAALALAATGSARVSGPDSASAKSAGTLVFGAEQGGGPDWCLNLILDVDCNAFWNVVFQTPVIRGAFLFTPKFTYKPDLITK